MRLFLGIDLPQPTKKSLHEQLQTMKKDHPHFHWVEPNNYHITLHFFGEVPDYKGIAKRLEDILYDAQSFYLYSTHMDIFVRRQLLLYLAFRREKKLEELVTTIRTDLGIEQNSKFVPHVTLSRSSLSSKQQYFALKNKIEKIGIDIEFKVDTIYLFESILTSRKPIYKRLAQFTLL